MMGVVWIEKAALLILHEKTIMVHGGSRGIRDELTATKVEAALTFLRLAAGEITEEELATWVERSLARWG